MYLLDTSILIDYLRLYPPAIQYLDTLLSDKKPNKRAPIALVTTLEMYAGARSKRSHELVNRFLKKFQMILMDSNIGHLSLSIMQEHSLVQNIDVPDSMIAATALRKGYTLLTRNLKHFESIKNLHVMCPY